MNVFFNILYTTIKIIVMFVVVIIELPIKIVLMVFAIMLFIILAFLTPLINKLKCPDWWGNFMYYSTHFNEWILPNWVNKNYKLD